MIHSKNQNRFQPPGGEGPGGAGRGRRNAAGRVRPGFGWAAALAVLAAVLLLPPDGRTLGAKPAPVAPQRPAARAEAAEKAPDFVVKDLNGRRFRLSDFRGKSPVLLIFGATWCTYCRQEIPHFKAIHATYAKQGLEVVYVDIQESKDKVAKFVKKYELPYRTLLDEDGTVAGVYDIRGVPSMVLVDRAGNIVCRQCRQVEPLIDSALK